MVRQRCSQFRMTGLHRTSETSRIIHKKGIYKQDLYVCLHPYKASITSTNTWPSGFLSLFIQHDILDPNDIIHNKIYFVCMGVFCLLCMTTKQYHKSYTFVCAWMWSFVACVCSWQGQRPKARVFFIALHCTFETVCLNLAVLSGWRLQACYHTWLLHCTRSGFRPSCQ